MANNHRSNPSNLLGFGLLGLLGLISLFLLGIGTELSAFALLDERKYLFAFLAYAPTNWALLCLFTFLLGQLFRSTRTAPGSKEGWVHRSSQVILLYLIFLLLMTLIRRDISGPYSQRSYLFGAMLLAVVSFLQGSRTNEQSDSKPGAINALLKRRLVEFKEENARIPLSYGEVMMGFFVMLLWLFLFAEGIMTGTKPLFDYINSSQNMQWFLFDSTIFLNTVFFWVLIFLAYSPTNVGLLCCLAGYSGMFCRRLRIDPKGDRRTRGVTLDYITATVSGFLVYLIFTSGIVIIGGTAALQANLAGNSSQADYAKYAATASIFSLIEGYKPFILGPLIQKLKEFLENLVRPRQQDQSQSEVIVRDDASPLRTPSDNPLKPEVNQEETVPPS